MADCSTLGVESLRRVILELVDETLITYTQEINMTSLVYVEK